MNKIDEHKSLAWNFILKTTSLDDENWVLSRAIHAIIRDGEFWHSEVRKRQDTINKLRKEIKTLRQKRKSPGEKYWEAVKAEGLKPEVCNHCCGTKTSTTTHSSGKLICARCGKQREKDENI